MKISNDPNLKQHTDCTCLAFYPIRDVISISIVFMSAKTIVCVNWDTTKKVIEKSKMFNKL